MATLIFSIIVMTIGLYCLLRGSGLIGKPSDRALLQKWRDENPWYLILGFAFFAIALYAVINSMRHKAEWQRQHARPQSESGDRSLSAHVPVVGQESPADRGHTSRMHHLLPLPA